MNNEVLQHITFSVISFNVVICNKYVSNANGRTTSIYPGTFLCITDKPEDGKVHVNPTKYHPFLGVSYNN